MNIVGLRFVLSTFVATALLAGCGGSQTQSGGLGAMPQSAALPVRSSQNIAAMGPNVACPVAGGKTYKTGNGHVSMKFWPVETTAPSRESWGVYLIYTGWKQDRLARVDSRDILPGRPVSIRCELLRTP